jgi:hypothetical protein
MTGKVMVELLREGVGQETTAFLKELGMLDLDALKCHLTGKLKSVTCSLNTDLEIILEA